MLPKVLSYLCVASVMIAVAVAIDRRQPLAKAFMPIKNIKAFYWQVILAIWVGLLALLELYDCPDLLGQRPWTWAYLMMIVYFWICLGGYFSRGR